MRSENSDSAFSTKDAEKGPVAPPKRCRSFPNLECRGLKHCCEITFQFVDLLGEVTINESKLPIVVCQE